MNFLFNISASAKMLSAVILFSIVFLFLVSPTAYGQSKILQGKSGSGKSTEQAATEAGLGTTSPTDVSINLINAVLGLVALVAVILIIYGGVTWMTAGGNEENITKAKHTIVAACIGLAIILLSWALTLYVISELQYATTTPAEAPAK